MRRFSPAIADTIAARVTLAVLFALSLALVPFATAASAASGFAQEQQPPDAEAPVEEEDPVEEEREDGAGAEENDGAGAGPADEEEGPPWTYQMARLSLAALAGLGLAVGAAYYRFVILRRRGYV